MDMTAVYAKTAKGQEEISARTYRLPQKLRLVLILVDGRLSVRAHREKAGALGDVIAYMEELERGGFIEAIVPDAGPRAPGAPASPGGTPAPAAALPLPDLKKNLNRVIHDYLGPDGDMFTEKIEKCRTREEVRSYYGSVQIAFREILGKRRAEELHMKCSPWLA